MCPAVPTMMFRMPLFFILLLGFAAALPAQERAVFKTGVVDVRVPVLATQGDQVVTDLAQSDFIVKDEGQPQPIVYFAKEKEPLNLLLLLDISGSMADHIQEMSATAQQALQALEPGDRVAIMTFGKTTNLHFGFFDNHAEVARQIQTATQDQDKVGYETAINAAIIDAAKYMDEAAGPGQRSILIVTDNLGTNYQANDQLVLGYLLKDDIVLNAIVVGHGIPATLDGAERAHSDYTVANVFALCPPTGGETVKVAQASTFFPEMVSRIRDRYTIAYREPDGAKAGSFHQITVNLTPAARVAHPGVLLRYRSGYYVR
jgi:VWFA-related protein